MDLIKTENCTGTYLFVCMREDRGYVVDEKLYSEEERKQVLLVLILILVQQKTFYVSSTLKSMKRSTTGDKCRALVYCNEDDDCVCITRRKDKTRQDLREQYLLRVFLATTKQSASARTWTTSSNCDKIPHPDDGKFIFFSCNKLRD